LSGGERTGECWLLCFTFENLTGFLSQQEEQEENKNRRKSQTLPSAKPDS
jgi:hypothetical protein